MTGIEILIGIKETTFKMSKAGALYITNKKGSIKYVGHIKHGIVTAECPTTKKLINVREEHVRVKKWIEDMETNPEKFTVIKKGLDTTSRPL
jgi:hypothetical protein